MTRKIVLFTVVAFFILWLSGLMLFGWSINHFAVVDNRKTDAIIALTGGRNRIAEAVSLFNQGKADRLFISGVDKSISFKDIQNTQQLKLNSRRTVELGHNSVNTVENARETCEWVRKNHIKSIRLVTSNYHVFRSLLEFHEQNPELEIIAHPVYSEKVEKKWWTSWQTFSLIFKEYNKLLYAYLRCEVFS